MISHRAECVLGLCLIAGILVAACVIGSLYTAFTAPLNAIADSSDPQNIVCAKWPRRPQLLEMELTEPEHQGAGRLARYPGPASHLAYGLLGHLRGRADAPKCLAS
jgi:hypothetical protein